MSDLKPESTNNQLDKDEVSILGTVIKFKPATDNVATFNTELPPTKWRKVDEDK